LSHDQGYYLGNGRTVVNYKHMQTFYIAIKFYHRYDLLPSYTVTELTCHRFDMLPI